MLRCPSDSCYGKSSAVKFPTFSCGRRHFWEPPASGGAGGAAPRGASCRGARRVFLLFPPGPGLGRCWKTPNLGVTSMGPRRAGPGQGGVLESSAFTQAGARLQGTRTLGKGGTGTLVGLVEPSPAGPEAFGRLHAAPSFGKLPPGAAIGLHGTESPSNERINKSYKAVGDLLDFNIREIMRAFLLACNITGPNRITTRLYPRAFPWRRAGFQPRGREAEPFS